MNLEKDIEVRDKIPFEEALNRTGFGLYSFLLSLLTGVVIISFACIAYSTTIIVPASACELGTTVSQQGILAAAPFIGSILGSLVWGYLGDTQGRRNMLMLSLALSIVFNAIASISVNWVMLMVFQFFATMMASGKYPLAITLLSESIPMARRNLVMLLVASVFLLSQGIMAGEGLHNEQGVRQVPPGDNSAEREHPHGATEPRNAAGGQGVPVVAGDHGRASGKYPLAITLLSESIPMARRNLVMLLVASVFLLSQGIMAVLAIPIIPLSFSYYLPALDIYWNSWRTVVVVYSLPGLVGLIGLVFVRESPKFLLLKGEEQQAVEVLRLIHKVNLTKGEFDVNGLLPEDSSKSKEKPKAKDQLVPLFKAPLLKYTIIMSLLFIFKQVNAFAIWMPRILDQFVSVMGRGEGGGMTLCAIIDASLLVPPDPDVVPCALNETALLYVLAVAGLQSFVNLLISSVVDRTGRRNMVIFTTLIIGLSGIVVNLVPNAIGSAVFFVIYLMGIMTLGLYTAMCVALFPTQVRAMAVALSVTGGRVVTFASIQILNSMLENGNCELGFYLFATIFTASAVVAAFLPDDRLLVRNDKEDKEVGNEQTIENRDDDKTQL